MHDIARLLAWYLYLCSVGVLTEGVVAGSWGLVFHLRILHWLVLLLLHLIQLLRLPLSNAIIIAAANALALEEIVKVLLPGEAVIL